MKFLIRDDDTCGFTRISDLEGCYSPIWNEVPINLSVTPFRIPGDFSSVPRQYRGKREPIALEENGELVDFLKDGYKKGRFDFALHGYHHIKKEQIPEYAFNVDLTAQTHEGKLYLENLLECQISTFVPPFNGIGKEGLRALIDNNLNLVGVPSLVRFSKRPFYPLAFLYQIKKHYYIKKFGIPFPYILSFGNHKEIAYCSLTPSQDLDKIIFYFEQCIKANGVFVLAVHYHAFEKRLRSGECIRDVVYQMVDIAKGTENVEFLTYAQLWASG